MKAATKMIAVSDNTGADLLTAPTAQLTLPTLGQPARWTEPRRIDSIEWRMHPFSRV